MIETEEFEFSPRMLSPEETMDDGDIELTLRPQTLHDYVGQEKVKENLAIYIEAAKRRGEPLDHVCAPEEHHEQQQQLSSSGEGEGFGKPGEKSTL